MKNKKGFTLIEVLAVVIILGLISSIAMVSVSRYRTKSLEREKTTIKNSIKDAYRNYRIINTVASKTKIEFTSLKFDKALTYNKKNCDLQKSYVYHVTKGEQSGEVIYNNDGSVATTEESKAEEICIHLECNGDVIIERDNNSYCKASDILN